MRTIAGKTHAKQVYTYKGDQCNTIIFKCNGDGRCTKCNTQKQFKAQSMAKPNCLIKSERTKQSNVYMRWGAGERRCAADGPAAQSIGKPKTVAAKPKALRAAHSPKALRAAHKPNALCAAHRTEARCAGKAVKLKSAERSKHLTSAERCKKTPRVQSAVRCNDCAGALPFRNTNENGLRCQPGSNAKLKP